MKSYSHRLMGIAILENMLQAENRLSKQAFLLGCIEPDYNFITYFRGSVKYDTLRGHNYENSFECMRRISDKLIGKRVWGAIEYYRLGKLIHYILDAFTYPHNGIFSGSIMEHREYERVLEPKFNSMIMYFDWNIQYNNILNIIDFIARYHSDYIKEKPGIDNDINYSLNAAASAAAALLPCRRTVMGGYALIVNKT